MAQMCLRVSSELDEFREWEAGPETPGVPRLRPPALLIDSGAESRRLTPAPHPGRVFGYLPLRTHLLFRLQGEKGWSRGRYQNLLYSNWGVSILPLIKFDLFTEIAWIFKCCSSQVVFQFSIIRNLHGSFFLTNISLKFLMYLLKVKEDLLVIWSKQSKAKQNNEEKNHSPRGTFFSPSHMHTQSCIGLIFLLLL